MKIAIPTEDKNMISEHFGGAPYFMVITIKNNDQNKMKKRDSSDLIR